MSRILSLLLLLVPSLLLLSEEGTIVYKARSTYFSTSTFDSSSTTKLVLIQSNPLKITSFDGNTIFHYADNNIYKLNSAKKTQVYKRRLESVRKVEKYIPQYKSTYLDWIPKMERSDKCRVVKSEYSTLYIYETPNKIDSLNYSYLDLDLKSFERKLHLNNKYLYSRIEWEASDTVLQHPILSEYTPVELPKKDKGIDTFAYDKYLNIKGDTLDFVKSDFFVIHGWYRGCGYCVNVHPIFNRLAENFEELVFYSLDVGKNMDMNLFNKYVSYHKIDNASKLMYSDISDYTNLPFNSYPTIIVVKNGTIVKRFEGYYSNIEDEVSGYLKNLK